MYLSEFREWVDALTKDVPDEFKAEVQIEFEYEGGYHDDTPYALLTVWYLRDETDDEQAGRIAENAQGEARRLRDEEMRERAAYERLKAKYAKEPTP